MHMRRRAIALHTRDGVRTVQPSSVIALCPTDGWTEISTLNAQAYGCFDLAEPTRAREVGARAKTSTAAAGARLYGLVIGMPRTRYR